jgi:hypothetical protein
MYGLQVYILYSVCAPVETAGAWRLVMIGPEPARGLILQAKRPDSRPQVADRHGNTKMTCPATEWPTGLGQTPDADASSVVSTCIPSAVASRSKKGGGIAATCRSLKRD